jgi:acyl-CoA synthetase (AMP-forming)/AMP-acid ligase II
MFRHPCVTGTEERARMNTVPTIDFLPTIPGLLARAVERYGNRDLIATPDDRATFAEVDAASRRLAKRLLVSGVGKGTRVGLHFSYSRGFLVTFLAVTRIGALAVPCSTSYAPGELRRALRRNDVHTFVVPPHLVGRDQLAFVEEAAPELAGRAGPLFLEELPHLRQILVLGDSDRPWAEGVDLSEDVDVLPDALLAAAEADVAPGDLLVVIQTSGSTAEPKGVVHTHGAVIRKMAGPMLGGGDEPEGPHAVFAAMPLFWIGGLIIIASALAHGTTMVCQERFGIESALDLIEEERCIAVSAWFGLIQALKTSPSVPSRDLSATPMLTEPVVDPPYNMVLGMTETIGPHLMVPHPRYGAQPPAHIRGTNGVAAPHFEHRLVTPDGEVVQGDGEGELCVRGYATLAGMYKKERHEVFDAGGWYHTGDRVRRVEDAFFFTGRVTEMIKTNGSNVAPPEVESVLHAIPGVRFAYVFGLPDAVRGEVVAAVVVPDEGAELSVAHLREVAGHELSSYKVPRVLEVMGESDVPVLATGKVDKLAMQRRLADLHGTSSSSA